MTQAELPILFLDVDGPLNPYAAKDKNLAKGYVRHRMTPKGHPGGLPVWLHPDHGRQLMELPYELVWATTWLDEANAFIAPHIGLPELPVCPVDPSYRGPAAHWKLPALIEYAQGRPFVWVDDEAWKSAWSWLQKHHGPHGEVHQVSDHAGLGVGDFYQLQGKAEHVARKYQEWLKAKAKGKEVETWGDVLGT